MVVLTPSLATADTLHGGEGELICLSLLPAELRGPGEVCGLRAHHTDGGGNLGPHSATAQAQSEGWGEDERDLNRAA